MTIVRTDWRWFKIRSWFDASDHQARQAILLRPEKDVLAFREYSTGNKQLDDDTTRLVVQLYLQDGISRMSPNAKEVLQIKGEAVPIRYLEMTIQEALRHFYNENPAVVIGKSSFYSLRPHQVKIWSPHQICMCQYHENMELVIQVSYNYEYRHSNAFSHGST